jgi:small GTP-binding protein
LFSLCSAGQEDYDQLRPLSYPNTNVFLVCFSVASPSSFDNVRSKWLPELNQHAPGVPLILVGTKSDMRGDSSVAEELATRGQAMVTEEQALQMVKTIGAIRYIECSALTQENLKDVFDAAIKAAHVNHPGKKKNCVLL